MAKCVCVCVHVCVCLAFISRGWLFAGGQVVFTVLLPCSVRLCVCVEAPRGTGSVVTLRTLAGTMRGKGLVLLHTHLCLFIAPSLILLFVIQVCFAEPNYLKHSRRYSKCSNRHILHLWIGDVADYIIIKQSVCFVSAPRSVLRICAASPLERD